MKYLLLLTGLWGFPTAQAQTFAYEVWYEGKVVLDTDDTLAGSVRFDLAENLLQLEMGNEIKAFSARKIAAFEIVDAVNQQTRQFYTLPYSAVSDYKVPVFFELLVQGDLTLLCRERLVTENVPVYGPYGYGFGRPGYYATRNRIAFEFFFGYPNGNVKAFSGSKKDFHYLVRDHGEELKAFVSDRKLRYNDRDDLSKIVTYYNYLSGQ
ncbi:MAG: hypothetical protein H7Z75_21840 [Ferruginibacter sp.]|nr:hypothetical protein [Cytophagales bacterium]